MAFKGIMELSEILQGFVAGSAANIVLNDKLGFGKVRGHSNFRLPQLRGHCRLLFLDRLRKPSLVASKHLHRPSLPL